MIAWCISFLLLCALWLTIARRYGPDIAVGAVILSACLVPTWCFINIADLPINVRLGATIFALAAYLFHPRSTYPLRLGWIDGLMMFLMVVHFVSDCVNDGFKPAQIVRMYGEWFVPYLAGRLAFQNSSSLRKLAPFGITAAIILGIFGALEALLEIRPWEMLYGQRLDENIPRNMPRWGIQRAWGCCGHPIYFGMLQLMYLPWLLRAWHAKESSRRILGLRVASLLGPAGILSCASRAPMLGMGLLPVVWSFVNFRKARWIFAGLLIVALLGGIVAKDRVLVILHEFGGEKLDGTGKKIVVDGATVEKTSAMTRLYLLQVYRRAALRAGILGFGTESVTGFPVRVPVGPEDSTALKNIWAIDNTYLLLTLRFGWLAGIGFFTALIMTGVTWIKRAKLMQGRDASFCIHLGAAVIAVALGLFTVWLPQDIGFPLLVLMGGASCRQVVATRSEKVGHSQHRSKQTVT